MGVMVLNRKSSYPNADKLNTKYNRQLPVCLRADCPGTASKNLITVTTDFQRRLAANFCLSRYNLSDSLIQQKLLLSQDERSFYAYLILFPSANA